MLYILDTDHISLLQRNHPGILAKLRAIPVENRAVTVVSVSEQVQGRLAVISRAETEFDAARGFERLQETMAFYLMTRRLSEFSSIFANQECRLEHKIYVLRQLR